MGRKDHVVHVGEQAPPGAYPIDDARPVGYTGRRGRNNQQHHAAAAHEEQQQQRPANSHIPPEMRMQQTNDETQQSEETNDVVMDHGHIPPEMRIQQSDEEAQQDENNNNNNNNTTTTEDAFYPEFQRIPVDASVRLAANNSTARDKKGTTSHQGRLGLVLLSILICLVLVTGLIVTLAIVLPTTQDPGNGSLNKVDTPTESPSTPSSLTMYDTLVVLLHRVSGDAIQDESSPQHRALNWLAYEDYSDVVKALVENEGGTAILIERYIIVLLYFSTNGPSWTKRTRFPSPLAVCSWGQKQNTNITEGSSSYLNVHIGCKEEENLVPTVNELRIGTYVRARRTMREKKTES
jgi:hypothetical protein